MTVAIQRPAGLHIRRPDIDLARVPRAAVQIAAIVYYAVSAFTWSVAQAIAAGFLYAFPTPNYLTYRFTIPGFALATAVSAYVVGQQLDQYTGSDRLIMSIVMFVLIGCSWGFAALKLFFPKEMLKR